jgi:hypothetical protein
VNSAAVPMGAGQPRHELQGIAAPPTTQRPQLAGARAIRLLSWMGSDSLHKNLSDDRQPALQGEDQVLGVQLELLQLDFLDLFFSER